MVEVVAIYKAYAMKDSGIALHYKDDKGEPHQFYLSHSVLAELGYGSTDKFGSSPSNGIGANTHEKVSVDWDNPMHRAVPGVTFDDD